MTENPFKSETWPPDKRGIITLCELNGVKFNILYTRELLEAGIIIHQYNMILF